MHVKKDDKVIIISGKDKGKTGAVTKSFPKLNRVIVVGVNISKRHQRPRKSGEKGQILDKAMPIDVSNVKLIENKKKRAPKAN
jgi:large subunit ribosomal protein L24